MRSYRAGHRKTLIQGRVPSMEQVAASYGYGDAIETAIAAPPPVLRVVEPIGAIPEREHADDEADTVPWCIVCESFGTEACLGHGPGHIPAKLGRVGR